MRIMRSVTRDHKNLYAASIFSIFGMGLLSGESNLKKAMLVALSRTSIDLQMTKLVPNAAIAQTRTRVTDENADSSLI